jgi:hypothetical protein
MEKEIAVRFYTNEKFGKGIFKKAIFSGTADLSQPSAKYLLDMLNYDDWRNAAKTDDDMDALAVVEELLGDASTSDVLATFIKRMDSDGTKSRVPGFCVFDDATKELVLVIRDDVNGVADKWELIAKPCKQVTGKKVPQLLASNAELPTASVKN